MSRPVGVVGSGPFGRALAKAVARAGHEVILWSRGAREAPASGIRVTSDLGTLAAAELSFVAVPSQHVSELASSLGAHLDGSHFLVHVNRGLVGDSLETLSHVLQRVTPCRRVGALAGPLVADALARGTPGGGVIGTRFPEVAEAVTASVASPSLRIYSTEDVTGVEVATAMVGILALASGYAQSQGMGPGALAVMASRGMAEAARLGTVMGAAEVTFFGLAGFGDLLAAMLGDDRPEIRLGRLLGEGKSLSEACAQTGTNIEGVDLARRIAARAARAGVQVPIAQAVAGVIGGELSVAQAVERLMTRRPTEEHR